MAGSGVSVGGTSMLRTRRRDVSIKPNRRLDRKSSRGMIYENEELRLRTININAEVEQGQNDIKKLRRENEQLRREIWSLRDEYDKLEELVKNQSSHGSSDELEGRSGEEDNVEDAYCTEEYSGDEDVLGEEEEEEEEEDEGVEEEEEEVASRKNDRSLQEEHLDNAENQKISSEKMNSNTHCRLHVEFDDLSVVDEEEEVKKDRDQKDSVVSNNGTIQHPVEHVSRNETMNFNPSELGFRYFPSSAVQATSSLANLHSNNLTASERKYLNDSPFVFPNPSDPNYPKMHLPIDNNSRIYTGQLTPLPSLDTPGIGTVDNVFGNNEFDGRRIDLPSAQSGTRIPKIFAHGDNTLPQRRNVQFKKFFNDTPLCASSSTETPNSGDVVNQNGWDFGNTSINNYQGNNKSALTTKHFFAPLPSRLRLQRTPEERFDVTTGATSSGSEKTSSTVISRACHLNPKGSADVCVNGGFPIDKVNHENLLSYEDVLIGEAGNVSSQSSSNPLVKSLSCQDLTSDQTQSITFPEKLKMFNGDQGDFQKLITKSDNTLDSIQKSESRPFRSQLNVTLKLPKSKAVDISPNDTPEIPKLPTINYRLFNNPFLQSFEQECAASYAALNFESPVTRPLSIQVNPSPVMGCFQQPVNQTGITENYPWSLRGAQKQAENESRLLLMAAGQLRNLEERNFGRQPIGFEVTSFEGPSPKTIIHPNMESDTMRRIGIQNHCMNSASGSLKSAAVQTQTSVDCPDQKTDEPESDIINGVPGSPLTLRRKRTLRKDRSGSVKDSSSKRPLSPAAQRRKERLRKQNSVTSTNSPPESPAKTPQRSRKFSMTTSTSPEVQDKNESRSSSSGQDSPKKAEQRRRVSLYFNSKKRPSLISTKTDGRRSSNECSGNLKERRYSSTIKADILQDATTTNSERERTNSVSSRDTATKERKLSTGSGKVPWCACWGNGCV